MRAPDPFSEADVNQTASRVVAVGDAGASLPGADMTVVPTLEEALAREPDAVLLQVAALRRLLSGSPEAMVSELRHALNNDLTAVLGFSQLLLARRAELSETCVKRVERIVEHAGRMTERLAKRDSPAAS